jgi:RNA polymerase sigma factor for flagellar operon FliA
VPFTLITRVRGRSVLRSSDARSSIECPLRPARIASKARHAVQEGSSYAIYKIRWSILDELRKVDPLSRQTRMRAHQTERTRDELVQKLGRAPTVSELAGHLGISVTEHRAFLEQYARAQVRSLEARLEYQGGRGAGLHDLIGDHSATDPAAAAERAEIRARLVRALEGLSEQERVVTTFYHYEGLTLREIGRVLDLTEGRVSQILHSARAVQAETR